MLGSTSKQIAQYYRACSYSRDACKYRSIKGKLCSCSSLLWKVYRHFIDHQRYWELGYEWEHELFGELLCQAWALQWGSRNILKVVSSWRLKKWGDSEISIRDLKQSLSASNEQEDRWMLRTILKRDFIGVKTARQVARWPHPTSPKYRNALLPAQ